MNSLKINPIESLLNESPFGLSLSDKKTLFNQAMFTAFKHHYENNELFKNFCDNQSISLNSEFEKLSDYPYLPVNIFKNKKLFSVNVDEINKTLNSSATSGIPSTIALDAITSKRQTLASAKVMSDYLGSYRRPFFILDEDPFKAKSKEISARLAATQGFLVLSNSTRGKRICPSVLCPWLEFD